MLLLLTVFLESNFFDVPHFTHVVMISLRSGSVSKIKRFPVLSACVCLFYNQLSRNKDWKELLELEVCMRTDLYSVDTT